jgi:uncharacterized protein
MRYLLPYIKKDLESKMVFVGGPRQAGKTTLAKHILSISRGVYLNYDYQDHRNLILSEGWKDQDELIVLDEFHKYYRWKNYLKGLYDVKKDIHKILVIGSARLDTFRHGGDSLLGRYFYYRLHPFSLHEIPNKIKPKEALERFMKLGGFPEPFLDGSDRFSRRWKRDRMQRIIKEDIRDLESVQMLSGLESLVSLLQKRVGSLIVIQNIANELLVSPKTVKNWIDILERMYVLFTVRPAKANLPRSLTKPFKIYFYDNSDVEGDEGVVFENLVATHLLKEIQFLEDVEGFKMQLNYIRDKEGREVDFAIQKDGKIETLIEVKLSDSDISKSLIYFSERVNPNQAIQIVYNQKSSYTKNQLLVTNPLDFFCKKL